MPERLPSHLQLALASVPVFTDDGRLDLAEVERLLALALADHRLGDDEKRVVRNIFARATADGVDADVQARIDAIREEQGLS